MIKRIFSIFLALCMLIGLAACTKQAEKPAEAQPDVIEIENVEREADKSASMWELVCRLFPDNVIFKDAAGNFTYKPVDKNLALDSYDWSSLSGTLKGIDVSYYQGDIDWAAVKNDGIKYAFIRLGYRGYTEGGLKMDVNFEKNVKGALENDIPVGVYFVTKALTEAEGVEEARYVIDNIKLYNISWPLVIDIEPTANESDRTSSLTPEQRTTSVLAFCDEVRKAGYTPMIYGGVGTFMSYLEFERLEGIEKWFAQYFNQPYLRYEFGIWQATSSGRVSGIKGDVDIDYAIKDYGAGDKK